MSFETFDHTIGQVSFSFSKSFGPRILSLQFGGRKNIFAELREEFLEYPGSNDFCFYGGHRLWIAPEDPAVTYIPDNQPVQILQTEDAVKLVQDICPKTHIQKSIQVQNTDHENVFIVDHFLNNQGQKSFRCAPWAITQLRVGGKIILPLKPLNDPANMLLPDRAVILWPYTGIQDERVTWENEMVFIDVQPIPRPLKMGAANAMNWIAYFIDDMLFIKYIKKISVNRLVDFGADRECYCNEKFAELETIGPLEILPPGTEIQHREIWRLMEYSSAELNKEKLMHSINEDELAVFCRSLLRCV